MIGSIRWNLIIGGLSGLLSFLFAMMNNNLLLTALIRGIITFTVLFLLVFMFRWLLALIVMDNGEKEYSEGDSREVGSHVDLTTPEQEIQLPKVSDNEAVGNQGQTEGPKNQQFQPFQPPRMLKKDEDHKEEDRKEKPLQPEQMVQAVRRLTED